MATNKRHNSPVLAGILMAIICLALVIILKPETSTGSAVYVEYYGISTEPLAEKTGIKTYVKLSGSTIRGLLYDARKMDVQVAEDILEVSDFKNGIIELYEANAPAPVKMDEFNAIVEGIDLLEKNFKRKTYCIEKAGLFHGWDLEEREFLIVTDLFYEKCDDEYVMNEKWFGAKAKHTYYEIDGKEICSEDSDVLFAVNEELGTINSNAGGC